MNNSKIIEKNTIYNSVKVIFTFLFPLISFPYTSRVLGVESIGKINFGQSVVSYFSLIATLGITPYAVRECGKIRFNRVELEKKSSQIFSINLISTLIAYVLLFILLAFPRFKEYRILILIQSMAIFFTTIGVEWMNMVMEDFKYITIRTMVFQIASLLMMFLLVHNNKDYYISAIISLVSTSGAYLLNFFYRKRWCSIKIVRDIDFNVHFKGIMRLFVMILAQNIYTNLDITMLGLISGDSAVGLYTTSTKIINMVTQLIASLTWVLMPQLSQAYYEKDNTKLRDLVRYAFLYSVTLGMPASIGILLFSKEIIFTIAGEGFLGATTCMKILIISMIASVFSNIFGNMMLLASNREGIFVKSCVIACFINIIGNAIFIPLLNINGAAITTCLSNVFISLLTFKYVKNELSGIDFLNIIKSPAWGCVAVIAVSVITKVCIHNMMVRFVISLFVGAILYVVVLIYMKNDLVLTLLESFNKFLKSRS